MLLQNFYMKKRDYNDAINDGIAIVINKKIF